jgi:hypothetical protein
LTARETRQPAPPGRGEPREAPARFPAPAGIVGEHEDALALEQRVRGDAQDVRLAAQDDLDVGRRAGRQRRARTRRRRRSASVSNVRLCSAASAM